MFLRSVWLGIIHSGVKTLNKMSYYVFRQIGSKIIYSSLFMYSFFVTELLLIVKCDLNATKVL